MTESTTDISSEMNSMEGELKQMKFMSRELLQSRVNEASKCSEMKIPNFQSVVCENCSRLEINYFHNLKASMKYYVLTQYNMFLDRLFQFRMIPPQLWNQILQYLTDEALLELAVATNGHRFYTKIKFSQTNCGC